ncbi:hypothetical protein DFJ74DRAFT_686375 [Hyaloraphidium curvatum]|nr:hypothetical protein DFJ74DRAFT_686375 [Hyaloraphidium curvatum]
MSHFANAYHVSLQLAIPRPRRSARHGRVHLEVVAPGAVRERDRGADRRERARGAVDVAPQRILSRRVAARRHGAQEVDVRVGDPPRGQVERHGDPSCGQRDGGDPRHGPATPRDGAGRRAGVRAPACAPVGKRRGADDQLAAVGAGGDGADDEGPPRCRGGAPRFGGEPAEGGSLCGGGIVSIHRSSGK